MTAAPKDIELNIPSAAPKTIQGTQVNFLNWRNWLATVIAIVLVIVAASYSFMNITERQKLLEIMGDMF
jgi:hypothetical protein